MNKTTLAAGTTGLILGAGLMLTAPSNATDAHEGSDGVRVQMKQNTVPFNGTDYCATAERHKVVGGEWSTWRIPFATVGPCGTRSTCCRPVHDKEPSHDAH